MSRPFSSRFYSASPALRINGKIRAREVRIIGEDGQQLGIMSLADAIRLAQGRGVDLVEVAATAVPPVCKVMDFHKYLYQQSKREKEARKNQHSTKMKEVQLSANIDPHDYTVKLGHATDFLCDDIKVKLSLRFRGREMAHTEYGVQVVDRFVADLAPYAQPDGPTKVVGRTINVMLNPLPRNKRAKNPRQSEGGDPPAAGAVPQPVPAGGRRVAVSAEALPPPASFRDNPFAKLDLPANR